MAKASLTLAMFLFWRFNALTAIIATWTDASH
jgi:hypothetical protein